MAQRQLTLLARRVSRPLLSSSLHRFLPHHLAEHCLLRQTISDINKIGIRSFSAGPRLPQRPGGAGKGTTGGKGTEPPGGKGIECPEKAASIPKQSVGKSAPVSPAADKVIPPQEKGSTSSGKSSTNYILIVGACSAIVIGLLTLYPRDLLKSVNLGKKEEKGQGPGTTSKSTAPETSSSPTSKEDVSVDDSTHLPASEKEEHKGTDEQDSNPTVDIETMVDQTRADSESREEGLQADTTQLHKKLSSGSAKEDSILDSSKQDETPELYDHQRPPAPSATEGIGDPVLVVPEEVIKVFPSTDIHLSPRSESPSQESLNDKLNKSVRELSSNSLTRPSLFEAYGLTNRDNSSADMQPKKAMKDHTDDSSFDKYGFTIKPLKVKEASVDGVRSGPNMEGEHSKAANNAVDVVELLHAAEKRQKDLDAHDHAEAEKKLKQAFHRELKDAQAKQLMYAEEASRLAKEIEIEKERADATLKSELEKASERLQMELDMKEEETDLKLKKADLLAKAEIAAAVAQEKLSYLKDVKDVKQELEALYKAFFAQSEEVRQSHTVHKLAVGTFALEDAMRRGVPIEREVALLCSSHGGAGTDPLLDALFSSLPKTVVQEGTMTPAQLHQKFEKMKSRVLELSLLQPLGSGLLSHTAAKIVSALKVKESGEYSDGIDSVVSQVQRRLADGKLAEAAELLEKSVHGTEAELLVADWVQSARDRAVMEQVLLLLQAHATAVASSLA